MSPKLASPQIAYVAVLLALSGCTGDVARSGATKQSPASWMDEATQRGLVFRHSTGVPRHLNIMQTTGSGGGFLDYDDDGWLDIYLVQGDTRSAGSGKLFHNRGDGTFEDVSAASGIKSTGFGMGVAVGDYDGDGRDDLFLCNYGKSQLFRNLGGGKFQDLTSIAGVSVSGWAVSAAFFDADRDGDLDLYICRYAHFGSKDRQLCYPDGIPASCTPKHYAAETDIYMENLGKGRFRNSTIAAGFKDPNGRTLGVAVADFNDDGNSDLLLSNDGTANALWLGDGRGHFRDQATLTGIAYNSLGKPTASMGVSVGDVDGDGRQDALIGNFQNESDTLFLNQGAAFVESSAGVGLAEATSPTLTFGVALVDWDNDGRLDTLQANGHVIDRIAEIDTLCTYRQPIQFFQQGEGGVFLDRSDSAGDALAGPAVSRGLALGDVDNDGRIDALVTAIDGPPRLLMNQSSPAHWLKLSLQGVPGNPHAIGARVTVRAEKVKRLADITASAGFAGSCDPRLNLGFGAYEGPVAVEVRWPDGTRTRRTGVPLNATVVLRQSEKASPS